MKRLQESDDKEEVKDFFLNEKPVDLLLKLRSFGYDNNYASALARDADVTYSHTVKCLQRMEDAGIVEFERKGRKKEVNLTNYGDQVADEFFDLIHAMTREGSR
jgi:DNA-binding MarR family transcriptional regulator